MYQIHECVSTGERCHGRKMCRDSRKPNSDNSWRLGIHPSVQTKVGPTKTGRPIESPISNTNNPQSRRQIWQKTSIGALVMGNAEMRSMVDTMVLPWAEVNYASQPNRAQMIQELALPQPVGTRHHNLPISAPAGPNLQHPIVPEAAPKPGLRDVESSETTVDSDDSTMAETQGNMSTAPQAANMTPALPVSEWDSPMMTMPAENFRRVMKELSPTDTHYYRTLRRKQQVELQTQSNRAT
ncbi:uncharacterized protein LOC120559614 [Perca fluviatilis]|uniref:uncharacterized protein LOC120559614 n=1 Tax=Perca fluviatilis TaxID=8168 RepID=UPI0019633154|nr:uncharacterized protein LOC120559614 [Perca fluviatilis]